MLIFLLLFAGLIQLSVIVLAIATSSVPWVLAVAFLLSAVINWVVNEGSK